MSFAQLAGAPEGAGCMMYRYGHHAFHSALRVTASLDAALALVERAMIGRGGLFTVQTDTRFHGVPRHEWTCRTEITVPSREFQGFAGGGDRSFVQCKAALIALLHALISQEQQP